MFSFQWVCSLRGGGFVIVNIHERTEMVLNNEENSMQPELQFFFFFNFTQTKTSHKEEEHKL